MEVYIDMSGERHDWRCWRIIPLVILVLTWMQTFQAAEAQFNKLLTPVNGPVRTFEKRLKHQHVPLWIMRLGIAAVKSR